MFVTAGALFVTGADFCIVLWFLEVRNFLPKNKDFPDSSGRLLSVRMASLLSDFTDRGGEMMSTVRARKLCCCGVSRYSIAVVIYAHTAKTCLPVFFSKSNLLFQANHVFCFRPGFIFANLPRGPPGIQFKFVFETLRVS